MSVSRRHFIQRSFIGLVFLSASPKSLFAGEGCGVQHPLMPPDKNFTGECDNCGMMRPMWARTWHTFVLANSLVQTCSIHCLAEMSYNGGMQPLSVMVADYLDPSSTIAAEDAFYVIGSSAKGTMSIESKIALSARKTAEKLVRECGGKVGRFDDAYKAAVAALVAENRMVQQKRVAKGTIVEPTDADLCPVCGMHVARYPDNKCQIMTKDGEVIHFCATQCLFEYLQNTAKYRDDTLHPKYVWVVDYASGLWIPAQKAYYVIGSSKRGPMGKEAFPFAVYGTADSFAQEHSGKLVEFKDVSIQALLM